jgi:hypothetical protein
MTTLFNLINPVPIDSSKKTIGFMTYKLLTEYDHVHGFTFPLVEYFKSKEYNVIFFGVEDMKALTSSKISNYYLFNPKRYDYLNTDELKRVAEMEGASEYNHQILLREFATCFGGPSPGCGVKVDKLFIISSTHVQLPLREYCKSTLAPHFETSNQNEYFDYVGDDTQVIDTINVLNKELVKNLNSKAVSLLAFTLYVKNIYFNLIRYLKETNPDFERAYGFIIDPVFYTPFFEHANIPFTPLYFADDSRGTRDMKKFPIAELQHLVYEPQKIASTGQSALLSFDDEAEEIEDLSKKEYDFFFMGTIFHSKGSRTDIWNEFFRDLRLENSHFYIPLKTNGPFMSEKISAYQQKKIQEAKDDYGDVFVSIQSHPMYNNYVLPKDVRKTARKYKYGFVGRCVSTQDSLNFRPVYYAALNIVPLFDYRYDPSFLQIPKALQNTLTCNNSNDIFRSVGWLNYDNGSRRQILDELQTLFKINEYSNDKNFWMKELDSFFDEENNAYTL